MTTEHHPRASGWYRSRTGLVLLAFLAIAAFFLVTEHRAHTLSALPFLLLLLCPLLHLFLHGRHGGGHAGHGSSPGQRPEGGER
jgi:Flp pilus assembly protein TadB